MNWKIDTIKKYNSNSLKNVKFTNNNITSSDELYTSGKGMIPIMNSNNYSNYIKKHKDTRAILNLDNKGNGTHWTGIKPSNDKSILLYQDSFGVPPPFRVNDKIIEYNPFVKQKINQSNCGMFAFNFVK